MPTLKDFYDMFRVPLGIMGAIAGFTGGFIAARLQNPSIDVIAILVKYYLECLAGIWIPFLIVTGVNALNDVFDLPSDIENNRTDRPLVRGAFNPRVIKWTSIGLITVGVLIAGWLFSVETFLLVAGFAFLGISYDIGVLGTNAKGIFGPLKREGVIGNVVVALAYTAPYALGSFAIGVSDLEAQLTILVMVCIVFTGAFGREVIKDIQDYKGDKSQGYKSLAILMGKKTAAYVGSVFLIISLVTSPLPLILRFRNNWLFAIALLPMWYFGGKTIVTILRDQRQPAAAKCRKYTRMTLWTGAIAFLLGALAIDFFY